MGDNLKRYRAINTKLMQLFPNASGRQKQYLLVLAALISGIVGSRHSHLPTVAAKIPGQDKNKRESRVKQYSRWLQNEQIRPQAYFAPFARELLLGLSTAPLTLVIDGSQVGRGFMALVIAVVYKGRALPLGWLVVKAKKGHLSQSLHIQLLKQVKPLVPDAAKVIFLGDGEFDGCRLLRRLQHYGWHYVCRTAKNSQVWLEDCHYSLEKLGVEPDQLICLPEVSFSKAGYGPVQTIAIWDSEYQKPIYLVTNFALAEEAAWYYRQRFHIETFFSDQKSRGFRLERSHISEPKRLARLLLAACLAYLWIIHLGTVAVAESWQRVFHRTKRCDLSLFSLGLNLLEHCLNEDMPLSVAFLPLIWDDF